MDTVLHDEVFLERPGPGRTTWKWHVGVNYFSAQGDRRWWHDHRFPAGIAFSMNSVGHMAKSGLLAKGLAALDEIVGDGGETPPHTKVDSLQKALELAMRTISMASESVSGKATSLLPLPHDPAVLPRCPIDLPRPLQGKNHCEYAGYYHTDYSLPSEYFVADVERPASQPQHRLDFTYLFDEALANWDFITMGSGRRIRGAHEAPAGPGDARAANVQILSRRVRHDVVDIAGVPRLSDALQGSNRM